MWCRLQSNKIDAVNRKWKERLRKKNESGYFSNEDCLVLADVHVADVLTHRQILSHLNITTTSASDSDNDASEL